jgi:hypothetical protein
MPFHGIKKLAAREKPLDIKAVPVHAKMEKVAALLTLM